MGYYGGAGARLMRSLGPLQGTAEPTPQDGARHLVECNWKAGFSLEIPKDWLSGVYLGKLSTMPRSPGSTSTWRCERELLHLHRPRRSQGRPAVPGVRHDLAVVQPLAAVAIALRPRLRTLGRHQRQGGLRRRIRSALRALLERIPGRLPPADQRLRRVPDDRVPARLLAGEGRLRRHLHLERRHARRREGTPARQGVPVGRPRRVLDRAHVRERHRGARCRRQPRVPLGQLDFRRRRAAAEQRRPAQPRDAPGRTRLPGRAGADGERRRTAWGSRTGPATGPSTGCSKGRT